MSERQNLPESFRCFCVSSLTGEETGEPQLWHIIETPKSRPAHQSSCVLICFNYCYFPRHFLSLTWLALDKNAPHTSCHLQDTEFNFFHTGNDAVFCPTFSCTFTWRAPFCRTPTSFFNNGIAGKRLALGAFMVRSKVWDWSMGSIQDPWYAILHPRAARSRAKRAFSSSRNKKPKPLSGRLKVPTIKQFLL